PAVSGTGVSIRAGGRLSEIRAGPRGDLSGGCGGPPCGGPSAEQSVLLGLYEPGIRLGVRAEGVRGGSGVESRRAVFQREPHARQLRLDLVDRLRTEVADVEEVRLGTGDELTHGVDALTLEAVVRPDRELELLDRQRQVG